MLAGFDQDGIHLPLWKCKVYAVFCLLKNKIIYDVFHYLDLFEVSLVYMIATHL